MSDNKPTSKDVDITSESIAPQRIRIVPQKIFIVTQNSASSQRKADVVWQAKSDGRQLTVIRSTKNSYDEQLTDGFRDCGLGFWMFIVGSEMIYSFKSETEE